tara:strand:- start:14156 stop:15529 length:1374 start_codon:yes stop_codon:yes gene_type:complete
MPSSALIQLVAIGNSDEYFTSNPDMSFYKYIYRKHTRFSMESVKTTFESKAPTLNSNFEVSRIKIPRHGDLLSDLQLIFTFPDVYSNDSLKFRWIKNAAPLLIRKADLYIGSFGRAIDTIYGEWLLIWNELTMTQHKKEAYDRMIGNVQHMINPRVLTSSIVLNRNRKVGYTYYPSSSDNKPSIKATNVVIPLPFYFTKDSKLSLPLCALQTNEVYITIETEDIENLYQIYDESENIYVSSKYYNDKYGTNINIHSFVKTTDINPYFECKYVYLDENERRLVTLNKQNSSFIVEHLYRKDIEVIDNTINIELNLTNPVKEIIWVIRRRDWKNYNTPNNYTGSVHETADNEILKTAKILWNKSNERVEEKDAVYFGKIQPYQHHTSVPKTGIYCYSFSLYPERWYPTGHFNPSGRYPISTHLQLQLNKYDNAEYEVIVYAKVYNILYIAGGLGGFKWS